LIHYCNSVAKQLPIDDQITSAAKLAVRARVHCGLWWTTASAEGRVLFHEALDEHWGAWRFVEHAQLVAFMVTIHNLYDDRSGTIRFKELSRQLGGVATDLIAEAQPLADKVRHFRNELFAHRTDKLSYAEVFKRGNISGNDMIRLAEMGVAIAATMLEARGLPAQPADDLSIAEMARILATLQRHYEVDTPARQDSLDQPV
jgi:hypothetical protein